MSVITGILGAITDGITNSISSLLKKLFVADGHVTTTDKPQTKQVESKVNSDDSSLGDYILNKYDDLKKQSEKSFDAICDATVAAGLTVKEIFWDTFVRNIEYTAKIYNRHFTSLQKKYDPKKEVDYSKLIKNKKDKILIDLTKFASAVPGYDVLVQVKDLLMEFAEFIGDYQDPFDTKTDPSKAIENMIKIIEDVINAFNPFLKYGAKIPVGWNETIQVLLLLADANKDADKKTPKKKTGYRRPQIPVEWKNAYEAACAAFSSIGKKSFMFIFWIIFKCLEAVVKLFEILGLDVIPPLDMITSILKLIDTGWMLFTDGPLAIKNILLGTMQKIAALFDGEAFSELPDSIEFTAFGYDLGSIESEVPTQETVDELAKQQGQLEGDLAKAEEERWAADMRGDSDAVKAAQEKIDNINDLLSDVKSELLDTREIVDANNATLMENYASDIYDALESTDLLQNTITDLKTEQQQLKERNDALAKEYDSFSEAAKNGYGEDAGEAYNIKLELDANTIKYDSISKDISNNLAAIAGNNEYIDKAAKSYSSTYINTTDDRIQEIVSTEKSKIYTPHLQSGLNITKI